MARRYFIVIAVLGFHVLALWALQVGLLRRATELVIPVEVLAQMIEPPQPLATPAPPTPKPPPRPQPAAPPQPVSRPKPAPRPAPAAAAVADPKPSPQAPVAAIEPQPRAAAMNEPVAAAAPAPGPLVPTAPSAPPAPAQVELPSSSADYLRNPPPAYPSLSRRLGEQGKVVVRVYIEANGRASKAEIQTSSGYHRLDRTALETVLKWRYVPGKRAGIAEAMWYSVPISFVMD